MVNKEIKGFEMEVLILLYVVSVLTTLALMYDDLGLIRESWEWKETYILIGGAFLPMINLIILQIAHDSLKAKS